MLTKLHFVNFSHLAVFNSRHASITARFAHFFCQKAQETGCRKDTNRGLNHFKRSKDQYGNDLDAQSTFNIQLPVMSMRGHCVALSSHIHISCFTYVLSCSYIVLVTNHKQRGKKISLKEIQKVTKQKVRAEMDPRGN